MLHRHFSQATAREFTRFRGELKPSGSEMRCRRWFQALRLPSDSRTGVNVRSEKFVVSMRVRSTGGRHRGLVLAVLCVAVFLNAIDNTIMNVASVSIARDLNASGGDLQWVLDGYTLVFASLLLTTGWLADRFGRRRLLMLGLAVFAAASLAGAMAESPGQLIAARCVMGVGSALMYPSTLALLSTVYTDPAERARAFGIWSAVAGLGVAFGPLVGGWLISSYYWGSVLLIGIPVALLALTATPVLLPESHEDRAEGLDLFGASLSTAGLMCGVWALIKAPGDGWGDPQVLGAFAAGALLLAAFVRWEKTTKNPMIDLTMFRDPRISAGVLSIGLAYFALFGAIFIVAPYLGGVLGYSPLRTGYALLPIAAGILFGAAVSSRIRANQGEKITAVMGLLLISCGTLILAGTSDSSTYLRLVPALVISGAGLAMTLQTTTASVMAAIPDRHAGRGSGLNDTGRMLGGAIGIAVMGSITRSVFADHTSDVPGGQGADIFALAHTTGMPAAFREQLHDAYIHAMTASAWVAAALAGVAAAIAALALPHFATPTARTETAARSLDQLRDDAFASQAR